MTYPVVEMDFWFKGSISCGLAGSLDVLLISLIPFPLTTLDFSCISLSPTSTIYEIISTASANEESKENIQISIGTGIQQKTMRYND